ncbi:MAG: molybdate ABC transporter substrate-binding protein [Deltaproteobacteria bacterium]|nr:molybdate ABC transporter substrate-binding protein [Deltaproteobacteria bacterium]
MLKKTIFYLMVGLAWTFSAQAAEVRLSVAASLTDAVKELVATYQTKTPNVKILPNFASSGTLAKQIAQGAPADLFISANPQWMQFLVDEQLIPADQVRAFVFNSLVFVGEKTRKISAMTDLAPLARIAIGSPKSTPVGQYAEQALTAAGLLDQVQGKLVIAQDVRQALAYAERGEVEGAFVYKTDALLARQTVILLEVPQELYSEVVYPLGVTNAGLTHLPVRAFLDFLGSAEARGILQSYGFIVK